MEDKKYTITLSDGTVLKDLTLSGNNFITTEKVTKYMFEGKCSPVIINDGTKNEVHDHMEFVAVNSYEPGKYWFVLRDYSSKELEIMQLQADVDYLAMMGNIDL